MLDDVGADAVDEEGGTSVDISGAKVLTRGVDFLVAEISEVCRGMRLGRAVAVPVEHVDAEDGVGGMREGEEGKREGGCGCPHGGDGAMERQKEDRRMSGTDDRGEREKKKKNERKGL